MALSEYWQAIKLAAEQGYRADLDAGIAYGPSGRALQIKRHGTQTYPTLNLHVSGLPRPSYTVHAHKFFAFLLWGERAFAAGVEVRHSPDKNTENNRRDNLKLGTSSENQMDKPPEIRAAAARKARAAQGRTPCNAKLSTEQVRAIKLELLKYPASPTGRVRRGEVKRIAKKFSVSPSTISLIARGKVWNATA